MNRISVIVIAGMFCMFLQHTSMAQQNDAVIKTKIIEPYHIAIGYSKTSNLIFPYAIKSVDRGSATVLVQKSKGVENILQVKAGAHNFEQTNLSVVTSDGQFYSFVLDYATEPSVLNISFYKDSVKEKQHAFLSETALNDEELKTIACKVLSERTFLHRSTRQQKIQLSLQSIYTAGSSMWFNLRLKNNSLIDYRPEYVRFFLQDKKRAKRTAVQQTELQPLYLESTQGVNRKQVTEMVAGFMPFTIPKTQQLIVQVAEQNGGRLLTLRVRHSAILKARLLK